MHDLADQITGRLMDDTVACGCAVTLGSNDTRRNRLFRVSEATIRGYDAGMRKGRLRKFVRQDCGFSPLVWLQVALLVAKVVAWIRTIRKGRGIE